MIAPLMSEKLAVMDAVAPRPSSRAPEAAIPAPSRFLGAWAAAEPGTLPTRLLITNVDEESASILYTWGDGAWEGTWLHARARVLVGGKLCWRFPGAVTLRLSSDGQALIGEREQAGRKALGSFRRTSAL